MPAPGDAGAAPGEAAPTRPKILVSACLLGAEVRYNGASKRSDHEILRRWVAEKRVVAVCPEVDGGLSVPRPPAEILPASDGLRVLRGEAAVVTNTGEDVTPQFVAGAERAAQVAREHGIRVAVLKANSPSCGSDYVYDGSFSGRRVPGPGVAAAALIAIGVRVFHELEIDAAAAFLDALGAGDAS